MLNYVPYEDLKPGVKIVSNELFTEYLGYKDVYTVIALIENRPPGAPVARLISQKGEIIELYFNHLYLFEIQENK